MQLVLLETLPTLSKSLDKLSPANQIHNKAAYSLQSFCMESGHGKSSEGKEGYRFGPHAI